MDDFGDEIPERRRGDRLVDYRLKQMEKQNEGNTKLIGEVKDDVSSLREDISKQFAELKQTLFERPIFVTYEIFKIELESRDKAIDTLKKERDGQVTASRFYISMGVAMFVAVFGPIIVKKLWGL